MRALLPIAAVGLLVSVVVGVSAAQAKDFGPGDLRVCNAKRCVPIVEAEVVAELRPFYYGGDRPRVVAAPRIGALAFELRLRNGRVTGIVATRRLDRFLSYGVRLGHFRRGAWHRVPKALALELRELARGLEPLRVTRAALARSR